MRVLVIIPTYNEANSLSELARKIMEVSPSCDLLIVDDNSRDGTQEIARRLSGGYPNRIFLLARPKKLGLGSAYIEGFRFALGGGYERVFEMDADLSHDPGDIPRFLAAMQEADVVVGSRYGGGIRVVNWPLGRLLLSLFGNFYARLLTGLGLADCTSGYKCLSRKALLCLPLEKIRTNGYGFQIEVNFYCRQAGLRIRQIPIVFTERPLGCSKMSAGIILEAAFLCLRLFLRRLHAPRRAGAAGASRCRS